jgi:ABC-2 type transport system ATP-binding protein
MQSGPENSSAPTSALKIADLKKVYGNGFEALKGVSLEVPRGEFFALLGPNGAGKSTLIGILSGLVVKSSGTAEVCGVSISQHPERAKSFIGLVPQEFNMDWFATVQDIVLNQAGYYGISRTDALPRVEQLLKDLGLYEKRHDQSRMLSGGMKRRLMIARALVHEPEVLLLDEPTAGVDVELRRGMWEFLKTLNEQGTTIILTTHYLEEAEQLCRQVAIINRGEIIKQGTVKSLLTNVNFVTLLLDTVAPVTTAELTLARDYPLTKIDDTTLQLKLAPGQTINDSIRKLSAIGVQISNIRNSGSRLEEVFINLIDKGNEEQDASEIKSNAAVKK